MASPDPILSLTQILAQFAQNVAEQTAHLRQQVDVAANSIHGFYKEGKRYVRAFDEGRGLRYRPAAISLSNPIVGAGVANAASDFFRVSNTEDFLVQSMRGFITLNSQPTEPNGTVAIGFATAVTMSMADIAKAKALNCMVTVQNKDNKLPVTENKPVSLASITPECGGHALVFGPDGVPGFVIPHNTTVEALFALQSAGAFFNTASTTYGVMLTGLYMSREAR